MACLVAFAAHGQAPNPQNQPPPEKEKQLKPAIPEPRVNIEPRTKRSATADEDRLDQRRANIRVDTTLVLIPVNVTDPLNRFVKDLDKEHFRIFEDNVEQEIKQFSSEDAPLSVGIVFDTSGSMGSKLAISRQAVAQFLKLANPEDEFFLVTFNDRPRLVQPFTSSTEEIQNKLSFVGSKGSTALLDGLYLAMATMKKARNPRKAILVISDGGDNSSRYTQTEVQNAVREADVQIYAVGIFEEGVYSGGGRSPEEMGGPGLMTKLAHETGGRHFALGNVAELPDVAEKIGIELRNQYVIGYTPKNTAWDGKYRRVRVTVAPIRNAPKMRAYYRLGYYAPLR
ncbi:MAG: VWA domain-containing protein [Bryobacteraceae bacterium]